VTGDPAVGSNQTIYECTTNGVEAIDATGHTLWQYKGAPDCVSLVIGDEGNVYFTDAVHLRALSPDGTVLWTAACTNLSYTSVGWDGHVYVEDYELPNSGGLLSLRAYDASGNLLWSANHDALEWTGSRVPVIGGDGTIYSESNAWAPDGTLRFQIPGNVRPMAIGADGTLYAASDWVLFAFSP
jgi:hypothetical protein